MNRQDDYSDNKFNHLLSAYKPRAWGEAIHSDSSSYSRPEPTSKTNIPARETALSIGSRVVPWN